MDCGIEFRFAESGLLADVEAFDASGKPIPVPHKIVVRPHFPRADARVDVLTSMVYADMASGEPLAKSVVQVLGTTGKLVAVDRNSVVPKFAQTAPKKAQAE